MNQKRTWSLTVLMVMGTLAWSSDQPGYMRDPVRSVNGVLWDLRPMIRWQQEMQKLPVLERQASLAGDATALNRAELKRKTLANQGAWAKQFFVIVGSDRDQPEFGNVNLQESILTPVLVLNVPGWAYGMIAAVPVGYAMKDGVRYRLYDYGEPIRRVSHQQGSE